MRKMKKINGFLVVRFNDREKRNNPTLGSFGVIDAEQYTGDLDFDLDAFEYTDADLIEIAVEQARGLDAEEDFGEEPTTYTVIAETAAEAREEEVEPKLLALARERKLETQIKSKHYPDIDPRTAFHNLEGYKAALYDLGLLEADEAVVEPDVFGAACQFYTDEDHRADVVLPSEAGPAVLSAHDFEEGETFTNCTVQTLKCRRCGMESFAWSKGPGPEQEEALAYVCDEVCRFREGRTQEELDAICEKCKVERWAQRYIPEPEPRERETFENLPSGMRDAPNTRKVYSLGLALAEECPGNDCKVYLNIFNMARELDKALDKVKPNSAPFLALRSALMQRARELGEMYFENYAIQQFKEGMQPRGSPPPCRRPGRSWRSSGASCSGRSGRSATPGPLCGPGPGRRRRSRRWRRTSRGRSSFSSSSRWRPSARRSGRRSRPSTRCWTGSSSSASPPPPCWASPPPPCY